MIKLRGTHHVAIICTDIERSKAFYCGTLGLKVVHETFRKERSSSKLDLELADGTRLELFTFPGSPPRPSYPEACGLRHLAFSVDDLNTATAKLKAAGVDVEEIRTDEITGSRFTFFSDPDGLPLELYEMEGRVPAMVPSNEENMVRLAEFFRADAERQIFDTGTPPWLLLRDLPELLRALIMKHPPVSGGSDGIFLHPGASVEPGAILKPPLYISEGCFIAAHAYLRGGVFLGKGVAVGPSCEIKQSIVFSGARFAHFNFIGDSLIGSDVNFEAGAHTANHWNERQEKNIEVVFDGRQIATGVQKFGSLIGDGSRIGANAVLCPGTILPRGSVVQRLALVNQAAQNQ